MLRIVSSSKKGKGKKEKKPSPHPKKNPPGEPSSHAEEKPVPLCRADEKEENLLPSLKKKGAVNYETSAAGGGGGRTPLPGEEGREKGGGGERNFSLPEKKEALVLGKMLRINMTRKKGEGGGEKNGLYNFEREKERGKGTKSNQITSF